MPKLPSLETNELVERAKAGRTSEELFRLLVDSVRDYAIFMLDPSGCVTTWNPGARRIKGYADDEILGRHLSTFYPEADVKAGKCEMELEVASQVGRFEDEGWRLRKDGTRFWANVIISAVRDERGELVGFSKVTRDLTERVRTEEERAARLAAEQANRAKDEFLAMLGHELRNPLAPIVTALQLMKLRGGGELTREQEIIERQVKHMTTLVDDLLDIARVTRGMLELRRRRVEMRAVLAKAIETSSPLLEQRQHHLAVDSPAGEAIVVDGDEARLAQVITNLLVNAAKYTDPGGHIDLTMRRDGADVVVEVKDDGNGIPAEILPVVFDLFVQGAQTPERSTGGLGIGLTLVNRLVALHGGTVGVHSPGIGQGSTFTVRLPLAPPEPSEDEKRISERRGRLAANARRVLVVDDNDDARDLLGDLLAAKGHEVRTAPDPAAALAEARVFAPDVAVLDIGLPGMDGYELARALRDLAPSSSMKLVALTGYGQPSDVERSRAAGFDMHLVKPVDVEKLLACIES
jgi:PAS domain S-box-containing protein